MSKQVAGKPEGATLLDAINDGDVEFPGRMTFMDWLKWRKSTGTRPLKKRDGVSTTLEEENVLWKEVMDFLHDAGEEELEEEEEEEEEEEQEADTAVEPAPPATHPAAGAHTGLTDEELAGLDATSVELLPDAERKAALAAPAFLHCILIPKNVLVRLVAARVLLPLRGATRAASKAKRQEGLKQPLGPCASDCIVLAGVMARSALLITE